MRILTWAEWCGIELWRKGTTRDGKRLLWVGYFTEVQVLPQPRRG